MVFPIGDENIKHGCKPIFSYAFIGFNVIMFIIQISTPGNLVCELAAIPGDILDGKNLHTLITSMFLHGGWMHLIGNLLFLWVFADNIEATIGNIPFLFFYIIGGLFASFAHIYFNQGAEDIMSCCKICATANPCAEGETPCYGFIPSLGASGAISAVMGAYLVMFPKSKVKILVIIFFRSFWIPAFLFLIAWFGMQLMSGIGDLSTSSSQSAGVAWWAHIGGFVFGLVFGFIYRFLIGKKEMNSTEMTTEDYV